MPTLTAEQIARAKARHTYRNPNDISHEHDDCVQMAYEWLDAQTKLKTCPPLRHFALKHIIEKWAGRYISRDDVEIAAAIHPDIKGSYPMFNLSRKLTMPSLSRLDGISEANSMPSYRSSLKRDSYKCFESGTKTRDALVM